jgi:hypothetical protein
MNSHELKLFKLHQCDSKLNEQIHFRKKKYIYINIKLITYVHMYIFQNNSHSMTTIYLEYRTF